MSAAFAGLDPCPPPTAAAWEATCRMIADGRMLVDEVASMLDHALDLARAGMHVFALAPRSKIPRAGTHGHLDATTDEEKIREWWTATPDANVGIFAKASGVLVIDVDPRNGGEDTIARDVANLGDLPSTATVTTGRGDGGRHLYFKLREGMKLPSKMGAGVDVKWNGMVLAPPSIHPSGYAYAWASGLAIDEVEIAELPVAWSNALAARAREAGVLATSGDGDPVSHEQWNGKGPWPSFPSFDDAPNAAYSLGERPARARQLLSSLEPAIQGDHGHDSTLLAAEKMGKGMAIADFATVYELMLEWDRSNVPPFGDNAELRRKTFEGIAKGHAIAWGKLLREKPPAARIEVSVPADPWSERLIVVPPAWYTTKPPSPEWLLRDRRTGRGVLVRGVVGQLIAEGGLGKTKALAQLAVAVATGTPWLGAIDVASPGRVLMLLGETQQAEGREQAQRLIHYACKAASVRPPEEGMIVMCPLSGAEVSFLARGAGGNPQRTTALASLMDRVDAIRDLRLVIVDPLSRFAGLDAETDNASGTAFIQAVEAISERCGANVLLAAHTNKISRGAGKVVDTSASRGSSALTDGARWNAQMGYERLDNLPEGDRDRISEIVTLWFGKANDSSKGDPIYLRRVAELDGALVPLDDDDLAVVSEAKKAKGTSRARERATAQADLGRDRVAVVASAIRNALQSAPDGLSGRALTGALVSTLGRCTRDDLAAGLSHLGVEVSDMRGPRNSIVHFLTERYPAPASRGEGPAF